MLQKDLTRLIENADKMNNHELLRRKLPFLTLAGVRALNRLQKSNGIHTFDTNLYLYGIGKYLNRNAIYSQCIGDFRFEHYLYNDCLSLKDFNYVSYKPIKSNEKYLYYCAEGNIMELKNIIKKDKERIIKLKLKLK